MKRTLLAAVLLAGTAILPIWAQQPPQQQDDDGNAPEHGVARISVANGDVSVRRGDSGELTAAALNGPLVMDDHLATGQSARAEIQFDWGNMIRLGGSTEVRLGELEDRRYLVQIATGTTTFRVLRDSGADVEISTPTVSVRPAEQGTYRITVFPDGTTEITVRSGRAEIFSPRGTESLTAGRTMQARGTPSDPEYMIIAAIPQDEFDRWNSDRDRALESTSSYRYVSPDVVGAEELDAYGRWQNDPEYGNVWVPTVDAGWAPYREGRWVDEPYYGWTWVSSDPWGWAPYHYGNWYQGSFGWAWYPGPIGGRHYWRPAMVGFFGWGSGGGFGFGFGNVGWVPLAPRERFRPWYGRGYNNTNIVNVTVINNYRNARFVNGRNGVTSINANDFGRGRRISSNNFVRASNNDLVRAGSVQGRLPFNASADGRRMSDRQVNTQSLPRVNANTRFAQPGRPQAPGQGQGQVGGQGRQAQVVGQPNGQFNGPSNNGPSNGGQANNGQPNGNGAGFRRFGGNQPNAPQPQGQGQGQVGGQGRQAQVVGQPNGPVNNGPANGNGNNQNGPGWRRFEGGAPNPSPNGNRGPVDRGQIDRGPRNNAPNGVTQAPRAQENRPASPGFPQGFPQQQQQQQDRQPRMRESAPQQGFPQGFPQQDRQPRMRESAPQQPVRISPPIVRERAPAPQVSRPEPRQEQPRGSFGQPRPQGGGNNGGNSGGGDRGGGNRGGGNGGNRGGGGGHDRH